MRCAICDAKLPSTQPLDNDICGECRWVITRTVHNELDDADGFDNLKIGVNMLSSLLGSLLVKAYTLEHNVMKTNVARTLRRYNRHCIVKE